MDSFTFWYVPGQIVVLMVILVILWRNKGWYAHTNTAASILTVVGVLGTFIGIYIGLQEFNPKALEDSIPDLLDGLKIAFRTSIVGIASALLLKGLISPLVQNFQKDRNDNPRQETIDEFVGALKKAFGESNLSSKLDALKDAIETDSKTTQDVLQDTRKDLTDIQSKTLKQLETLTTTVSDEHSQLRKDREATRDVLADTKNELTGGQAKILGQLETLTSTISDKSDLTITSQANEGSETRKTLANMQSELTGRQNKAFIQLRELTKTVSYEHSQLRKEFENFSKNVAESITELATKELISSLTKVIDQFNTQLSTQFGDNFKQLNEAVGKTVAWQEQYRQQMNTLAEEFRIAAESIEKSKESVALIAKRSESIVACTEKLDPILHTLNDQLDAFNALRQRAHKAFPLIESRLDELTTGFSSAVQTAITDSHESVEAQREALTAQSVLLQMTVGDTSEKFSQLNERFLESVENTIADSHRSMEVQRSALAAHGNTLQTTINEITQRVGTTMVEVSKTVDTSQSAMNQQLQELSQLTRQFQLNLKLLEATLEESLTESLDSLVGKLAALSNKFVEDYGPLTEELHKLVNMARSNQIDRNF